MIEWANAARVAQMVGGSPPTPPVPVDLAALADDARERVVAYTKMTPIGALPAPEWLSRAEWIDSSLQSMRPLLGLLSDRIGGELGGPRRLIAGTLLSVQVGALTGYLSARVLGQYDMPLLDATGPTRLLLVAPNLAEVSQRLDAQRADLLRWVTLHEVTHAVQFGSVPWLRPYVGDLLRSVLDGLELHMDPARVLRLPGSTDLRRLLETVRSGSLITLALGGERRALFDRVQTTMAVIEGHAEHVMDAVGAEVIPTQAALRAAMERRRLTRSPPIRMLERMLGLELKMRQYRDGKRFCDQVVDRGGVTALGRLWGSPETLPSAAELLDADAWLARTAAAPLPAG